MATNRTQPIPAPYRHARRLHHPSDTLVLPTDRGTFAVVDTRSVWFGDDLRTMFLLATARMVTDSTYGHLTVEFDIPDFLTPNGNPYPTGMRSWELAATLAHTYGDTAAEWLAADLYSAVYASYNGGDPTA